MSSFTTTVDAYNATSELRVGGSATTGDISIGPQLTTGEIHIGHAGQTGNVYLKGNMVPADKVVLVDTLQLSDQLGRDIVNISTHLEYVRTGNQVIFSFSLDYQDTAEWQIGGTSDVIVTGFPWTWSTIMGTPIYWPAGNPWQNLVKGNNFICTSQDGTSEMWMRTYNTQSDHSLLETNLFKNSPNLLAISGSALVDP